MVDAVRAAGPPQPELRELVRSASPLLAAAVAILAVHDLTARPWATLAALSGAGAAFVWAALRLGAKELPAPAILVVAALLRIALVPLPLSLSDDMYRYLWDGRLVAAGWNPYFHAPEDPALESLRGELWEQVAHREVETVYPPLALVAFSVAARLPWPLLAWKAMLVTVDLLSCVLLLRLARARAVPTGRAIAYAWNPMVVLEVAGMGHVDALGVLPLLAGALLLVEPVPGAAPSDPRSAALRLAVARRRSAAAGAALGLAILAKLVPLLAVPAWTRAASHRGRFLVATLTLLAVAVVPFTLGAPGLPPGLVTYAVSWEWNGPLFEPLWRAIERSGAVDWVKWRLFDLEAATGQHALWPRVYSFVYPQFLAKMVLAAALVAVVWISSRRRDPIEAALFVFGAMMLLSATVYPWYALWMLPWAALLWSVPWLVLSLSLLASYLPRLLDVPLLPWPFLLVWSPFAIVWLLKLARAIARTTAAPTA